MSRLVTSRVLSLTRRYLADPAPFWGEAGARQVRKLAAMKRQLRGGGLSEADALDEVMAVAQLRVRHAPAPICLANIGSSGSHWLEGMLSQCSETISCGEVYLPNGLLAELRSLPESERSFFLHALYAVHAGRPVTQLLCGRFINSAHYSRRSRVAGLVSGTSAVLLIRHPFDVVMSRTLRKAEYRDEIAPGESDEDYLERNCALVERFYEEAMAEPFDTRVRYEDLVERPAQTLVDLLGALGLPADRPAVDRAVEQTEASTVAAAAARGEKAATNLFLGEARQADVALEERARQRLMACAARLGYE